MERMIQIEIAVLIATVNVMSSKLTQLNEPCITLRSDVIHDRLNPNFMVQEMFNKAESFQIFK
jgi:predicted amino acid racemase